MASISYSHKEFSQIFLNISQNVKENFECYLKLKQEFPPLILLKTDNYQVVKFQDVCHADFHGSWSSDQNWVNFI
jgi:hypothetical protein